MTGEIKFVFALIAVATVLMASNRGCYRFTNFVKVGVPLLFRTYLVTLVVTPFIFTFHTA